MNVVSGKNNPRQSRCAFTLAEVMVAVALVLVLFLSLYAGISSGFVVTQVARENLRATQIMLERMEGLRLYNWNQVVYSNMIPNTFTDYFYPLAAQGESKGIAYSGTLVITNVNFTNAVSYSNEMRLVTVTVTWQTSNGHTNKITHKRSVQTYVGRSGIQNYVYYN